jgi:hypothetical protein
LAFAARARGSAVSTASRHRQRRDGQARPNLVVLVYRGEKRSHCLWAIRVRSSVFRDGLY